MDHEATLFLQEVPGAHTLRVTASGVPVSAAGPIVILDTE